MAKTIKNLAGYLFYKERVEKQLESQEPLFFSSYVSEDKFRKAQSSGKGKKREPPSVVGKDKNGKIVSYSSQSFFNGPGFQRAFFKFVNYSDGNSITRNLSLLRAYTEGYIVEGYADGTSKKQQSAFIEIMKSYERSAKSLLKRHDGSFKDLPSFVVMSHSFVASNLKHSATSTINQKGKNYSSEDKEKVVVSTYFAPIINGKLAVLPSIDSKARKLRDEETKKWIPFEPVSTNYNKTKMSGFAEISTQTRGITMELTKRRLKEIIAEEMNHLAETGDLNMITEAEKKAFEIILEKLTPKQLEEMGLKRV